MGLTDNGNGFYMNVVPSGGNGGGWGNSFGGDGAWWFLVLLFALGGNWGGGYGNNGAAPYIMNSNTDNAVQRGFDQQAVMNGINGLTTGISGVQQSICNSTGNIVGAINNGFSNAEISANGRQMSNMQQMFNLQSQLSQCCCDNRLATAQLGSLVQAENCNDRQVFSDGVRDILVQNTANTQRLVDTTTSSVQSIYDKLCQMESDGIKRDYENRISALQEALQNERQANMFARFDASQNGQTATIQAGQRALASEVEQYVLPTARPAYIVQNPNCCPNYGWNNGGCCNG